MSVRIAGSGTLWQLAHCLTNSCSVFLSPAPNPAELASATPRRTIREFMVVASTRIMADSGPIAHREPAPNSRAPMAAFSSTPPTGTIGGVVSERSGKIGKAAALEVLGLGPDAPEQEILRAYKALASPLKRALTSALSLDQKNQQRKQLKRFVEARNAALGRTRETGTGAELSAAPILEKLDGISTERPDRDTAVRAMGLAANAPDADVLALYKVWYRALTRALGAASTGDSMRRIQLARMKMQGLRVFIFDWWDDDEDSATNNPDGSLESSTFEAAMDVHTSAALRQATGASFTTEDLVIPGAEPETDSDAFGDLDLDFDTDDDPPRAD